MNLTYPLVFVLKCTLHVETQKTLLFFHISPSENNVGETLCSLNSASRVRGIELGQTRKQADVGEVSRYKLMVLYCIVNLCFSTLASIFFILNAYIWFC